MPEGDTIYRAAKKMHAALAGQVLTGFDLRVPKYATADLTGERIDEVVSVGKHLLHRIGDYTLHSHLKMEGQWQVYERGQRWQRPAFEARAVLDTADAQAVGFALGVTELVRRDEEDLVVGHLGPDLLGLWTADDAAEALRRLLAQPEVPVYVALLDQRNLAGIGNVYANELCFVRGLAPTRPIGEVANLPGVIALARRMLFTNRDRSARVFTGVNRPGRRFWVYGRGGKPCLRCGTPIEHGTLGPNELQERDLWWCPVDQT